MAELNQAIGVKFATCAVLRSSSRSTHRRLLRAGQVGHEVRRRAASCRQGRRRQVGGDFRARSHASRCVCTHDGGAETGRRLPGSDAGRSKPGRQHLQRHVRLLSRDGADSAGSSSPTLASRLGCDSRTSASASTNLASLLLTLQLLRDGYAAAVFRRADVLRRHLHWLGQRLQDRLHRRCAAMSQDRAQSEDVPHAQHRRYAALLRSRLIARRPGRIVLQPPLP